MDKPPRTYKRAYYRLRYPLVERPKVRTEGGDYEVSEVSERGIRIVLTGSYVFRRDQPFAGVLRFRYGMNVSIEGVVLRSDKKELIVALSKGPSREQMLFRNGNP